MVVGGVDLSVRASVNHCSTPIDVTFAVRSLASFDRRPPHEESTRSAKSIPAPPPTQPDISWQYTFVTTNQAEAREVPGFESSARIMLHLLANATRLTAAASKVKR